MGSDKDTVTAWKESDFTTFEFDPKDPKKPDPKDEPAPSPPVPVADLTEPMLAIERFAHKVAHRGKLVDAEALKAELAVEQKDVEEPRSIESPVDRLQRLKREASKLQANIRALANTQAVVTSSEAHNSTEAELGRALSASSAGPWMAYQAPCPGLLDASPTAAAKVTNQALVSSRAGDASAVLSLMAPEKSRGAGMLEKLEAMEQSVGEGKGMFPGLAGLMRQLELLSDIRLETLSHRLKEVTRELATRDLKRTGITFQEGMEETEAHQRIIKIEALMGKWKPMDKISPAISKLQSNGEEHQRAAECVLRLQKLKERSAAVVQVASSDKEALDAVTEHLVANLNVMKANIASLQERVNALG